MLVFFAWNLCNCANWTFSSILDHISSCFLQAIFISIWCLWAKSLYILATSHLLKKKESKTLQEEEQTPKKNPFWCVLLQSTVCPPRPPSHPANECPDVGVCGRSLERGGAAAASQHRSNKRTGSWALFGGCEWAPSPPSEMWTDIWTLLLFHSVILRLHLVTGNPERARITTGGK